MTRDEFKRLFLNILEETAFLAEVEHNLEIPRHYEIEIHGLGYNVTYPFEYLDVDGTVDALFIDEHSFIPLIDVFVKGISRKRNIARVFVRPIAATPTELENTWNYKLGKGPFKLMIAMNIRNIDETD